MTLTHVRLLGAWLTGGAIVGGCVASLAQTPPSAPASQQPPSAATSEAAPDTRATIRAIGCVVELDTSGMRTGTTDRPKSDTYRGTSSRLALKDVVTGPDATPEKSAGSRRELGLQSEKIDLDRYIGQLVEVTGTLIAAEPAKRAGKPAADPPQPPRTLAAGGNAILATAVRALKPKC